MNRSEELQAWRDELRNARRGLEPPLYCTRCLGMMEWRWSDASGALMESRPYCPHCDRVVEPADMAADTMPQAEFDEASKWAERPLTIGAAKERADQFACGQRLLEKALPVASALYCFIQEADIALRRDPDIERLREALEAAQEAYDRVVDYMRASRGGPTGSPRW